MDSKMKRGWEGLGDILAKASWSVSGSSWAVLKASWTVLEGSWGVLEASWGLLEVWSSSTPLHGRGTAVARGWHGGGGAEASY